MTKRFKCRKTTCVVLGKLELYLNEAQQVVCNGQVVSVIMEQNILREIPLFGNQWIFLQMIDTEATERNVTNVRVRMVNYSESQGQERSAWNSAQKKTVSCLGTSAIGFPHESQDARCKWDGKSCHQSTLKYPDGESLSDLGLRSLVVAGDVTLDRADNLLIGGSGFGIGDVKTAIGGLTSSLGSAKSGRASSGSSSGIFWNGEKILITLQNIINASQARLFVWNHFTVGFLKAPQPFL